MEIEEAMMVIQAIQNKIWEQLAESEHEAIELAFEALKKQIPKKIVIKHIPKTSWTKATSRCECPCCNMVTGFGWANYCSCCGQKLD